MRRSDKPSYEFGPFRLDAAEYVLLRDGQVIPLSPKVFETLLVLVENSGHVVDKNELLKQVWQDVVVEETNLTKNISILRKILGDGDGERSFIETVPKRGYRFVVPVRKHGSEDNENGSKSAASLDKTNAVLPFTSSKPHLVPAPARETAARQPEFQRFVETDEPADYSSLKLATAPRPTSSAESIFSKIKTNKFAFAGVLGIAALLVAGVGFGISKFAVGKKTGISLASTQITRLTSSGTVIKAAISADGKWLVYIENDDEHMSLWLKQVAVPESNTQIVGPADWYQGVAISPDGNYVYYTLAERGDPTAALYQVPVLGGTSRKLFTGIFGPVAFSADGKQIAYFSWVNGEDLLMVANADGSGQRQLLARGGNEYLLYGMYGPSWSPDSKTLLTTIGSYTPQQSTTVAAVSPKDGALTLFSQQKFRRIDDIAWLSEGQGVLVSASDQLGPGGSGQIWRISYPSGEGQKLTNDLNSYRTISPTADSNILATVQTETLGNLWIASMNDLDHGSQITSGTHLANFPSWAPDGKVVYALKSGGNVDLYLLDPGEGTPKQLTSNSGNNHYPVVSPDGRYVVFSSDRSGVLCLWRIDIDGSNPTQLTNETSEVPRFGPDHRTIVYISNVNKYTLSTVSIDGGEPRPLTTKEAIWPVFSPDGSRIACLYLEQPNSAYKISIIPANGGAPITTFPQPSGMNVPLRWTPDGKALLYGITRRGVTNLWMHPLEGGAPKQLTNFTSDRIHSFEVSRDGKQLVFSRGTTSSDVVLFSGLRQ